MELDVIRRVLEEIKFKVERDVNLTQLDQENYIVIVGALEKQIPKPLRHKYTNDTGVCNECEQVVMLYDRYCSYCGNKLAT